MANVYELEDNYQHQAEFICAIARPDGTIALETEGVCPGEILTQARGEGGFGYDPIFYVPKLQETFAQMSSETKNRVSHRGKAFAQLLPELKKL